MREEIGLPEFSLEERDRRWTAVRALMRGQGLDCLILCGMPYKWDFFVANARFLSQIGGNGEFNFLLFPSEGEPTSFISLPTFVPYWKGTQKWVRDIRAKKGPWADNIAPRLRELGLEKGRMGLDGMSGALEPDGWFPQSIADRLRALLPEAQLVSTDDMLERVRALKSPEEIGFLRRRPAWAT